MSYVQPILAESLAAKMEKLENFELPELFDEFAKEPGLVRTLWFLQYVSWPRNYAGGLSKFAADLIDSSLDSIGPASLRAGQVERFDLKEAIQVLRELPECRRPELLGHNTELFQEAFLHGEHRKNRKEWTPQFLATLTPRAVRDICVSAARDGLADYLKELCELPHISFRSHAPWYFARLSDALFEFIERRRETLRSRIAETEITQLVSRWITKSRHTKEAVMITGNSRFGKTEALKLHAEMHPGNCRLVNTPASNTLGELIREIAITLGMEVSARNLGRDLRERVEYVLRFSHLQLCFDEAQFLLPTAFSRNTAPARLNWVRRSVMDQFIPAVFVCTPQSYLPAKKRFVKTTGFAMEQFDERVARVELPAELSQADLLAVARIHFADLSDGYLHFVVDNALATERNYVSDIQKIATFAKDNAREHGRKAPIMADIKAAIADVLPTPIAVPSIAPGAPARRSIQSAGKRDATSLQAPRTPALAPSQNRRDMQAVGT